MARSIPPPPNPYPNHKVFVIIIYSPIFGGPNNPPQGFDFDDFNETPAEDAPQHQGSARAPSLLSDQFLDPITKDADDAMEESQQYVTSALVHAGKQRASTSCQEEPDPDD
jgi:hypothetical protein